MSCLTPEGALSGDCDFLSANMYARSLFGQFGTPFYAATRTNIITGEDALANLSVERTEDGSITGHVRIRSKTQGIALSFKITHCSARPGPSQRMLPKMTPVSVDDTYEDISGYISLVRNKRTLMVALMLWKLWGATVYTDGRSTSLRSPSVAKSRQRFCKVSAVWLTRRTSNHQILTDIP